MGHRRSIATELVARAVSDLVERASFSMPAGVVDIYRAMRERESSEIARHVLDVLVENAAIARGERLPLCQDCGVAIVFCDVGQDVALEGEYLHAVDRGVQATNGCLRKSSWRTRLRGQHRDQHSVISPRILFRAIASGLPCT